MADTKDSLLTETTTPAASDTVAIISGATNKKAQIQNMVKAATAIWARVYHNADQSLTTGTPTVLAFNSERADTDVIHDNTTNNSRLTCKTAGVYHISATLTFAANATGYRSVNFKLNGTTYIAAVAVTPLTGVPTQMTIQTTYVLAVNDYVQVEASQTSGAGLNVSALANYSPEFMMIRLGA